MGFIARRRGAVGDGGERGEGERDALVQGAALDQAQGQVCDLLELGGVPEGLDSGRALRPEGSGGAAGEGGSDWACDLRPAGLQAACLCGHGPAGSVRNAV